MFFTENMIEQRELQLEIVFSFHLKKGRLAPNSTYRSLKICTPNFQIFDVYADSSGNRPLLH